MRRWTRSAVVTVLGCLAAACSYQTTALPPALPREAQTSRIFAADGTLITVLRAEENRDVVVFADLPRTLIDAVVAIEDERFWTHHGVDPRGILRAVGANASAGGISQGGSTITQQYVKNALLDPSQTVNRKVREALLAWRLEQTYSKETILERYLNTIYFGHGAYGAQTAAAEYFGKPVKELDLAESALLAGLIQAPSALNPFDDPEAAVERRDLVLGRMLDIGSIDSATHDSAVAAPVRLTKEYDSSDRYEAAHFVEEVKQFILEDPRFGATPELRRALLFTGGLRITTTINLKLQAEAEKAVAGVLTEPETNPSGAVVALDPTTGEVRAMVGGRDYFGPSKTAKYNLAVGDGRQAGSTFKPLVLAAAIEGGIPLGRTYRAPGQVEIPLSGGQAPWKVANYDGRNAGTVDLIEATTWSYNTAYAQLMRDVGPGKAVDMATRLGIRSPLLPVPAAVLGTESVTVLEMASAYGTLANRGVHIDPVLITRIVGPDGGLIYESQPLNAPVLEPAVADQVTYALRQVVERGTGTAARLGRPVAGKTGTAEDYGDAWFVGYTPQLVTAVWVGFVGGQIPMVPPRTPFRVAGGSWPTEIWHDFMAVATEGLPVERFTEPERSALSARSGGPRGEPIPGLESTTTTSPTTTTKKDGTTTSSGPTTSTTKKGGDSSTTTTDATSSTSSTTTTTTVKDSTTTTAEPPTTTTTKAPDGKGAAVTANSNDEKPQ